MDYCKCNSRPARIPHCQSDHSCRFCCWTADHEDTAYVSWHHRCTQSTCMKTTNKKTWVMCLDDVAIARFCEYSTYKSPKSNSNPLNREVSKYTRILRYRFCYRPDGLWISPRFHRPRCLCVWHEWLIIIFSPVAIVRVRHHRHTVRLSVCTEVQLTLGPRRLHTGRTNHVILETARTFALQRLPVETDVELRARLGVRLRVDAHLGADLGVAEIRGADGGAGHEAAENDCEIENESVTNWGTHKTAMNTHQDLSSLQYRSRFKAIGLRAPSFIRAHIFDVAVHHPCTTPRSYPVWQYFPSHRKTASYLSRRAFDELSFGPCVCVHVCVCPILLIKIWMRDNERAEHPGKISPSLRICSCREHHTTDVIWTWRARLTGISFCCRFLSNLPQCATFDFGVCVCVSTCR